MIGMCVVCDRHARTWGSFDATNATQWLGNLLPCTGTTRLHAFFHLWGWLHCTAQRQQQQQQRKHGADMTSCGVGRAETRLDSLCVCLHACPCLLVARRSTALARVGAVAFTVAARLLYNPVQGCPLSPTHGIWFLPCPQCPPLLLNLPYPFASLRFATGGGRAAAA